jgi:2-polyprenyl-3-methyl-5-hydroxy-6-metoxy-1,4-benzoquinol methylase
MEEYEFKKVDFENPSFLFVMEDRLKDLIGGPLFYRPYFDTFALNGDERVLDFGCGGGSGSKVLIKYLSDGGSLTATDVSNYWIEKAEKRLKKYSNATCVAGDIREVKIDDNEFDVITIMHVIHDIEPKQRRDVVTALCKKLKKGGRLFLREPIKQSHGMPVEEIRTLFSGGGLKEQDFKVVRGEYIGRWHNFCPTF